MKKGKKISGGKYKKQRKRRIRDLQGQKSAVKLGKIKRKSKRISGGKKKVVLLSADEINVKTKDGKIKKVKIKNVLETPSNKFLARQNIITKGTILETELGRVRVSSRPSQSGILNGIVVD
ncbi:MAG: 30S ribosomal protein S8e [Nanoarchaeota archaeon]